MAITQSKKFYWVVTQGGKLVVINGQLPFYWTKKAAVDASKLYRGKATKVSGKALEALVEDSI